MIHDYYLLTRSSISGKIDANADCSFEFDSTIALPFTYGNARPVLLRAMLLCSRQRTTRKQKGIVTNFNYFFLETTIVVVVELRGERDDVER